MTNPLKNVFHFAFCTLHFALFIAFFSTPAAALSTEQVSNVIVQPRSESILVEAYLDPARAEPIMLVGGQFDRFLSSTMYIGGSISGAVSGGVGGYGLGAFSLGYRSELLSGLLVDLRCNVGGAGGGGVKAGGGLLVEPLIGLVWTLPAVELKAQAGYLFFLTSNYSVPVLSVGVSFPFKHLYIP